MEESCLLFNFSFSYNRDVGRDALIALQEVLHFAWLIRVKAIVSVPFSNAVFSESAFYRIELVLTVYISTF